MDEMNQLYSYHVFLFPFQWTPIGKEKEDFSERHDLTKLKVRPDSQWKNQPEPKTQDYQTELYNEKNFFYKFLHTMLYDDGKDLHPVIKHYERTEAYKNELIYEIGVKANSESNYKLKIKSIGLDVFSTGTGVLIFYLENETYKDLCDVKRINQFGRRIFPPFLDKETFVDGTKGSELADFISIHGLMGEDFRYSEDFTRFKEPWGTARFIESLVDDFSCNIKIEPVVDDRMFTMCWFFNKELGTEISKTKQYLKFVRSNQWHEYLYVDTGDSTCRNDQMQKELLKCHTYERWQKSGILYGITKYSFMAISTDDWFPKNILLTHFRTIYVRIVEIALIQRSTVLKFSAEVTRFSALAETNKTKIASQISDFYKSYIRFVNQIYFREVTAQEQGIELYDMLTGNMRIKDQVKDLDNEIGELHNYATLLDEKSQSRNLSLLTILGSLFLVPSFIVGYFGMNFFDGEKIRLNYSYLPLIIILILAVAAGLFGIVRFNRLEKKGFVTFLIISLAVFIIFLLLLPIIIS